MHFADPLNPRAPRGEARRPDEGVPERASRRVLGPRGLREHRYASCLIFSLTSG